MCRVSLIDRIFVVSRAGQAGRKGAPIDMAESQDLVLRYLLPHILELFPKFAEEDLEFSLCSRL